MIEPTIGGGNNKEEEARKNTTSENMRRRVPQKGENSTQAPAKSSGYIKNRASGTGQEMGEKNAAGGQRKKVPTAFEKKCEEYRRKTPRGSNPLPDPVEPRKTRVVTKEEREMMDEFIKYREEDEFEERRHECLDLSSFARLEERARCRFRRPTGKGQSLNFTPKITEGPCGMCHRYRCKAGECPGVKKDIPTPKPEDIQCEYEWCLDRASHTVRHCLCLHWICYGCGRRGHKKAQCQKWWTRGGLAHWATFLNKGIYLQFHRRNERWLN